MTLRSTISDFWKAIQLKLFPFLDEELGKLTEAHKRLISVLELIRIEELVPDFGAFTGRPRKDRRAIARCFIAKCLMKITYTKQFIELLRLDPILRRICGWETKKEIPSESKFSRVFNEFASYSLPDKVHQALIKELYQDETVGHVVKDSTPIEVREKPLKKDKNEQKRKKAERRAQKRKGILNRREKQLQEKDVSKLIDSLPKFCDVGMKKSAKGSSVIWSGYKLHAAIDDNCIPLAIIVTSASLNDCEAAIPLAEKCDNVVTSLYDLMDSAYDHPEIISHSISLGHIPIIDKCPNGIQEKMDKEAEKKRLKALNFKTAEQTRYARRFPCERFNALYKDYYGGRTIKYRGHMKVSCEVMFGVLALTAVSLLNLIQ